MLKQMLLFFIKTKYDKILKGEEEMEQTKSFI
jgi:hypothetical protein